MKELLFVIYLLCRTCQPISSYITCTYIYTCISKRFYWVGCFQMLLRYIFEKKKHTMCAVVCCRYNIIVDISIYGEEEEKLKQKATITTHANQTTLCESF